ncbi:glycosyltransferase [Hafnia alvei]|uniref:O-antigen biosynthesis glycosyltransferase WbnH n=2 Tax=Hafnia alvei TaxID=569 RepID=A0A172X0S0_HAFAL|nr:glycosyltransferase [Hafnia alvei]ANF30153.1 O-antigen biosynthesis glycosyltransferase WbnH [Hafnia alvei]KFC86790.1 exopolysaccharide biosynthesis glycosyltransferase [Hafnia alvei ATCC 13337]MCV9377855.1 glycosyltransferase [Hafnia alvei]MDX6847653.1 glycosyltransferase [Hafnia alvei]MEB7891610.1 glycosyltransferase [Hafnia alvei]
MKNLVFVITKSEIGGAQTWVYELTKLLSEQYNIYLITSSEGWLTDKYPNNNVSIIPSLAKMSGFTSIYHISRELRRFRADIVISSSANAGIFSRLSKLFYKHKHIYVSHGWSCIYNSGKFKKVLCMIERGLSMLADKVLCVSDGDLEKARSIIRIDKKKLVVIRNSISPLPVKEITHLPLKIVFVGRMTYPKRPELLAEVVAENKFVELYFVGGGEYLSDLITRFKHCDNIFFAGEVPEFNNYFEYDIFALCSDSEGLPMSAIEAGSSGLPLLLSDVGGCRELIFDGLNGIVYQNSKESLSYALQKIVNNYDEYRKNASFVMCEFDINRNKQNYIDLIG